MPTYEYVCKKCGHEFETRQSMSEPALKNCPKELCAQKKWGRGKVTKQIGAGAGLLFKGDGFYITDYRSEGYKSSAKKDYAPTKVEPKAAPKTEPKPAAKPEKK
ncbi:MAG TPA: zinc ribbon domain-containing protein [Verrucomicrobiae bacterium]